MDLAATSIGATDNKPSRTTHSSRPRSPSLPACSPPSRTLRAAFGGGQEAILDCVCARWPVKSAVGAEECLRRGRTKELDQALAFRPAIREREKPSAIDEQDG